VVIKQDVTAWVAAITFPDAILIDVYCGGMVFKLNKSGFPA